jgi:hypothetical protein
MMTSKRRAAAHAVIAASLCLLVARPANAQTFFELGAGPARIGAAPTGETYGPAFSSRLSVGRRITRNFALRLDVISTQYDHDLQLYPPCAYPGCSQTYYQSHTEHLTAVTANALFNLDRRGLFYLIGGVGLYSTSDGGSAITSLGTSAGAGVSIPTGTRLHFFIEARDHFLTDSNGQPPWFAPITFGIRL